MASSREKCNFCNGYMNVPQNGWCLKDSTYAKLCVPCASAFRDGTFCLQYHKDEDGWRNCDECDRQVHCGCIMAVHTFELNDITGVTCRECLGKKSLAVSSIGSSSSGSSPKDCFLLEDSCKFHDSVAGELLADPGRLKPLNDEMQERDKASHEGYLKQSQLTKSGRIFLFEKKLTPSDCDLRVGRLLLPKLHAEKLIHQPPAQRKKLVVINDTEGGFWNFTMRWWPNKRSRKYVLDGARQCREKMQWNVGDILKFYRQLSDGKMIMELQKGCECTSSVIPVAVDAPKLGTEQ